MNKEQRYRAAVSFDLAADRMIGLTKAIKDSMITYNSPEAAMEHSQAIAQQGAREVMDLMLREQQDQIDRLVGVVTQQTEQIRLLSEMVSKIIESGMTVTTTKSETVEQQIKVKEQVLAHSRETVAETPTVRRVMDSGVSEPIRRRFYPDAVRVVNPVDPENAIILPEEPGMTEKRPRRKLGDMFNFVHVPLTENGRIRWKNDDMNERDTAFQVVYELERYNGYDLSTVQNIDKSLYVSIKQRLKGIEWSVIVENARKFAKK